MVHFFGHLNAWAQSQGECLLFYLLAAIAIIMAYGMLLDRRIIRCGFLLIGVFSSIAGLFLVLSAQFIAMAQVMIYAVGITLVVVIALMLTNPKLEEEFSPALVAHKGPALAIALLTFATIYLAINSEKWACVQQSLPVDNVKTIGLALLTYYSLPFEFASILLLVALVGAIMLAKSEKCPSSKVECVLDAAEEPVSKG